MSAIVSSVRADCDSDTQEWQITVGRYGSGRYYGDPSAADVPADVLKSVLAWAARGLASHGNSGDAIIAAIKAGT